MDAVGKLDLAGDKEDKPVVVLDNQQKVVAVVVDNLLVAAVLDMEDLRGDNKDYLEAVDHSFSPLQISGLLFVKSKTR